MAKIRRSDKREMPALNTSSLPDIIFMLLFFFMSVTSMKESDQGLMTVSIKADKETKMGIIADIKQELRRAYALKISYAATQRTSY